MMVEGVLALFPVVAAELPRGAVLEKPPSAAEVAEPAVAAVIDFVALFRFYSSF
jgi:hypothetical protein